MSRNLATNCGSLDSLNRRIRWGCRPWARQMRWTELTLIPTALAMAAPVQWVACAGGPAKVKATTRSAISGLNGGMRDGRVLSRHSPAAPSEPNRSCQRQMTVLAFPVRRTISAVPCPAAVSRTILARQTCFCGLFRLATTAFNAARSVALSLIWVLSCIPQTRMTESAGESARESKSQIWSTRSDRTFRTAAICAHSSEPQIFPRELAHRGAAHQLHVALYFSSHQPERSLDAGLA